MITNEKAILVFSHRGHRVKIEVFVKNSVSFVFSVARYLHGENN